MSANSKNKLTRGVYVFVVLFCVFALLYQVRKNLKEYKKRMEYIEEVKESDYDHPLLLANDSYGRFVSAMDQISGTGDARFWVISEDYYPIVAANYFLYPDHAMVMNVQTQEEIFDYWLFGKGGMPETRRPPIKYDNTIHVTGKVAKIFNMPDEDER
jgi:hypothetical protein